MAGKWARNNAAAKADKILVAVLIGFIGAVIWKHILPASLPAQMVSMVLEAALVGGIADWFAVTALFRRPLGFAWHTALIPNNRGKIVKAIATAVEQELLTKEAIKKRLVEADLMGMVINWLETHRGTESVEVNGSRYAKILLAKLADPEVVRWVQKLLRHFLHQEQFIAQLTRKLSDWMDKGEGDQLAEYLLEEGKLWLEQDSTCNFIQQELEKFKHAAAQSWWEQLVLNIAELTDMLNLAAAAKALQVVGLEMLQEMKVPNHPLRQKLRRRLTQGVETLAEDPDWQQVVIRWQRGLLAGQELGKLLAEMVASLLAAGAASPGIAHWMGVQTVDMWEYVKTHAELQEWLNNKLKTVLVELLDVEQQLAAIVVEEALQKMSDEALSQFVEDKAGEDLAWIRINGSVVGAIVGLFLFLLLHYGYAPLLGL